MHQYAASDLFCCSNLGEQEASPLLCSLIFQLTVYIVSAPIIAWVTADAEILEKVCSGRYFNSAIRRSQLTVQQFKRRLNGRP